MDGILELLIEALNNVPQDYYRLRTTYSQEGIVRERVFCYELYHRIRCLQNNGRLPCIHIHGEIDKSGHVLFEREDQKNPDFIFHVPGSMQGNALVIEVKGKLSGWHADRDNDEALKDLDTLAKFCRSYEYQNGLWLIYNYSLIEVKRILRDKFRDKNMHCYMDVVESICVLCKKSFESEEEHCTLSTLM